MPVGSIGLQFKLLSPVLCWLFVDAFSACLSLYRDLTLPYAANEAMHDAPEPMKDMSTLATEETTAGSLRADRTLVRNCTDIVSLA